jgi:drug/metabolite transporter (DMT)-like permease
MTDLAPARQAKPSRALEGILCVEVGMLFFVVQDGMMKALLGTYPVWMLVFARAAMAVMILGPVILIKGAPNRFLTPLWPLHFARAALFTVGFTLFYAAFPFMGLAEVTTLFFAAPLITAVLAPFWLKETIGPHSLFALIVGFIGVVISMNPTSGAFQWDAIFPLICAATYAVSHIIARIIGDRETTITTGFYTIAMSGVLIVPLGWLVNQVFEFGPEFSHLRWEWPGLTLTGTAQLALLGVVGSLPLKLNFAKSAHEWLCWRGAMKVRTMKRTILAGALVLAFTGAAQADV